MQSHYYLKLLFCCFLFQSILAEDVISISSASNSSTNFPGILDKSPGLNDTLFNSTLLNNTVPVLLNCTGGLNNSTDLSKCTPINITLTYECVKVDYDFLIYSVAWQPKLCYSKNCDRPYETPKWRIQGLRGSFYNGTRPVQCCSDRQLKINEITSILPEIKDAWAYEKDENVTESIVEEWNLHGSCVQETEQKTSPQLFSKALDLYKKIPLEKWLSNAKIEPSNDKKYGLQFFNYTILSKAYKRFQLRCKTFDYDKRISLIDTINFCVDKHSSEFIDCPADFESNCLDMIYYNTHLLEYKVTDEVRYRDMNYYRYQNYHRSYSPMMTGALTGAAIGAIPAAALALPAAYYYFKNKNKYEKNKYNSGFGGYGGGFGSTMPWYASTSYSNSFAPHNFNNLGGGNNLYPRQTYSNNFYPSSIYSGVQGNRNFGNLNTPDLSPNFYSRPGSNYPSYPNYPSSGNYPNYPPPKYSPSAPGFSGSYPGSNNPSYPSYPGSNNNPSYPSYSNNKVQGNSPSYPSYPNTGSNLPNAPPAYSTIDKNSPYPKQPSYDKPPAYSPVDKNSNPYKPSAPSLGDLDKGKNSGSLYPKLGDSGKHSPSAPSFSDLNDKSKSSYPSYPSTSNVNKPSYPSYPSSSNNKPSSSSSNSKPKSSGFSWGSIFGSKPKSSSSSSSSGRSRSSGSSSSRSRGGFGGSRSGGISFGRSRG